MLFALTACGSKKADTASGKLNLSISDKYKGQFRVGFARMEILPDDSVPLSGYGNTQNRMSIGYRDVLYVDATAISDKDNNTVIIMAFDNIGIYNTATNENLLSAVSKKTGVPVGNIACNASHTHSAPDTSMASIDTVADYIVKLTNNFAEAAYRAMNNRVPAKMFIGETETVGLNFVRHYFAQRTTGETIALGDNHNSVDFSGTITKHTTDADPTLYLLKFEREGEKDVYLTNFRAHPTLTGASGTSYDISSDFVGIYREEFEKAVKDSYCSYLQGAAGNLNAFSRIESETKSRYFREHGKMLSEYAVTLSKNLKEIETGKVAAKRFEYVGQVNHTEDNKLAAAQIVAAHWKTSTSATETTRLAVKYDIASPYHANAIIAKAKLGKTLKINLSVIGIGDVGLTFVPFEQFDTNAIQIQEGSPYKYTIAMGYTNGVIGYIPSEFGYEYGCYESDTGRFAPGTGEDIANRLVKELKTLKNTAK